MSTSHRFAASQKLSPPHPENKNEIPKPEKLPVPALHHGRAGTSAADRPNRTLRTREHLTETEVEKLIDAAKDNRYGHRDSTMILVAYRHEWEQVDFPAAAMHVNRVKNGNGSNPAEATPRPVAP